MEDEVTRWFWPSWETGYTAMTRGLQDSGALGWFFGNLIEAPYNLLFALTHPGMWLSWLPYVNQTIPEDGIKQALMRFVYFGASVELFFVLFFLFLVVTAVGVARRSVLWSVVRGLEGFANKVGRFCAWSGLVMVAIQIVIIFMQRVFAVNELSLAFGAGFSREISWWAEGLKFWNAIVVALCAAYTFVQGGHVRVDLVYAAVGYRAKKIIDMVGSLLFMLPMALVIWLYGWFFMWRSLINPPVAASNTYVQLVEQKWRAVRWNIETIGFSPNGFDAYWLFKLLLVSFCVTIMLQAIAFFYRSYLELVEGPESEGKYLDRDTLGEGQEAYEGTH